MTESTNNVVRGPTDALYLESIQDPFFKSVVDQVIPPLSTGGTSTTSTLKSPQARLDALEIALRKQVLQMMMEYRQGNMNIDEEEIVNQTGTFWKSSLDVCHHLVYYASQEKVTDKRYEGMDSRRLPILLISDCIDGLPSIQASQKFWKDYLEPALQHVLFQDLFWNDAKTTCHLPFLKVCNQFLKALERSAENTTEWKGRILWDLAKGFSVADKSSLKLWGSFHSTNTTDYETRIEFEDQNNNNKNDNSISSTTLLSPTLPSSPVEYSLYEAFWSLQGDFSNPNHIKVGDFIKKLRLVLTALESAVSNKSNTPMVLSQSELSTISKKYLTSSVLLPSQIATPSFRCSVVTQFLIVGWHLSTESPPLKNALSGLLTRARKLLQTDNPEFFDLVWNGILSSGREDDWRQWKKQKCPAKPFEVLVQGQSMDKDGSPKRKKSRLMDGPLGDGKEENTSFTTQEYDFLTLEDLKSISKEHCERLPRLEKHLEPYVEALDPEAGIEDAYHPKNDSMFTWQALRLYSRQQLPLLRFCRRPDDLERITRLWYKSKGEEIPGDIPPETEGIDQEEDQDGQDETTSSEKQPENHQIKESEKEQPPPQAMLSENHKEKESDKEQSLRQAIKMEDVTDEEEQTSMNEDTKSQDSQSKLSHSQSQPHVKVEMEINISTKANDTDGDKKDPNRIKEEINDFETKRKRGQEDEVSSLDPEVKGNAEKAIKAEALTDTKQTTTEKQNSENKDVRLGGKGDTSVQEQEAADKTKPQDNRGTGGKDIGKQLPSPRSAPIHRDGGKPNPHPRDIRRNNDGGRNRLGPHDDRRNRNETPQQSRVQGGGRPEDGHRRGGGGISTSGGGRHSQSGDRFGGGPRSGRGDGRSGRGNVGRPYRRK